MGHVSSVLALSAMVMRNDKGNVVVEVFVQAANAWPEIVLFVVHGNDDLDRRSARRLDMGQFIRQLHRCHELTIACEPAVNLNPT